MVGNSGAGLAALYPVLCVDDPAASAKAFCALFGLQAVFEADWYVHLKGDGDLQIAFVAIDHESVPEAERKPARGLFVTIDCNDVAAFWMASHEQLDVVTPLVDESWGQRHFICRIPGGVLVDVVQLLPAT